jgi:hypothetical protein
VLVQDEPATASVEGGEVSRAERHDRDTQRLERHQRSRKVQNALRAGRDHGDRMVSKGGQVRGDIARIPAVDPANTAGGDHVDPHAGRSEHRR